MTTERLFVKGIVSGFVFWGLLALAACWGLSR